MSAMGDLAQALSAERERSFMLRSALVKAEKLMSMNVIHVDPTTGEAKSPVMKEIREALEKTS